MPKQTLECKLKYFTERSMKIDESVEDTVTLLSQFSCVRFSLDLFDIGLKGFHANHL